MIYIFWLVVIYIFIMWAGTKAGDSMSLEERERFRKECDEAEEKAWMIHEMKKSSQPHQKELSPQQKHYQEMKALSDRQAENARKWEQELAEDWLDEHDDF